MEWLRVSTSNHNRTTNSLKGPVRERMMGTRTDVGTENFQSAHRAVIPLSTNRWAMARPMPEPAPVTITRLPPRRLMFLSESGFVKLAGRDGYSGKMAGSRPMVPTRLLACSGV